MLETIEQLVRQALEQAQQSNDLPVFEVDDLGLERPNDANNGDWTSTVALRSAKAARMAPRAIAGALVEHMPSSSVVEKVEVAGPGFINFYLSKAAANDIFRQAINEDMSFGMSQMGKDTTVQVEFVSANPVGPLHVGHGRWAALGDSLCRVLEHAGYTVAREYYINDHGSQMDVFGTSLAVRYEQLVQLMCSHSYTADDACEVLLNDREAFADDENNEHPEAHPLSNEFTDKTGGNAYGGAYIVELACEFIAAKGDTLMELSEEERTVLLREQGYQMMLASIRETCSKARCDFDLWFSERSLYEKDADGTTPVSRAFDALDKGGYLYSTEDGALWFRSTEFGDDKDRVLIKTNGEYTYFASDVAYHWDKFQRCDYVIDVWGADHHGYIGRVAAVCDALGYPGRFEVVLGQLVNLLRAGNPVRMSKRRGTMVTFDELLHEVGADAVRYTLVSKSSNQTIDFDIEAAKRRAMDNPVYYVQYAHARICSILRKAAGIEQADSAIDMNALAQDLLRDGYDVSLLTDPSEEALARKLSEFAELIEGCARDRAPFRLTHYAEELAAAFHSFYTNCPILAGGSREVSDELSRARLAVCDAVRRVLVLTLSLVGVSAPQAM